MSNEAPADDEVTARVRAAVAGAFQPEHVNGFPMRPDAVSIDLVRSFLVYGFDSGFPWLPFFKLLFVLAGTDRRPVLEASSKGGRGQP